MTDFNTALDTFIAGCQKISNEHDQKWFARLNETRELRIEVTGGKKFIGIDRSEYLRDNGTKTSGSRHCFVAAEAGSNKKLGAWKAGDVFKADGYKGPAKGVRGNIFDEANGLGRMGEYGPAYNRG